MLEPTHSPGLLRRGQKTEEGTGMFVGTGNCPCRWPIRTNWLAENFRGFKVGVELLGNPME
jgi:hypothetical protein